MGSENVSRVALDESTCTALSIALGTRSGRVLTVCSESGDSLDMAESVTSDAEPECSTQSLFDEAANCDEMRVDSGFPKYSHIVNLLVDLRLSLIVIKDLLATHQKSTGIKHVGKIFPKNILILHWVNSQNSKCTRRTGPYAR